MDLLGSIMSKMDAPPSTIDKEKLESRRAQKEKMAKLQAEERKRKQEFREQVEQKITRFIQDATNTRLKFEPMNKVDRSIVHDVAEVAGLTSFSFGEDEVDRYVMLFKKEFPPPDEELEAYRRGEEYDPEAAKLKELAKQRKESSQEELTKATPSSSSVQPRTNYRDKYKHLIGEDSGKDAAKITKANQSFGFVPSKNKTDKRSIEETLNEIRAKKQRAQSSSEEKP